jgi:hypothetical protein
VSAEETDATRNLSVPDPNAHIERLIARSSLGTPEAEELRATVSDATAAAIVARSKEMAAARGLSVADLHAVLGALIEAGRGGDEVTFGWTELANDGMSDSTRRELEWHDWTLREVMESPEGDYFLTLRFEPARRPKR